MAYINGTMYAIGQQGNLYTVDIFSGDATFVAQVGNITFQGLTAGPPNVENGKYADILFSTGYSPLPASRAIVRFRHHGRSAADLQQQQRRHIRQQRAVAGRV